MIHTFFQFRSGTSVVLNDVATSPVMTVTSAREQDGMSFYKVCWLGGSGQRFEAEYPETELMPLVE